MGGIAPQRAADLPSSWLCIENQRATKHATLPICPCPCHCACRNWLLLVHHLCFFAITAVGFFQRAFPVLKVSGLTLLMAGKLSGHVEPCMWSKIRDGTASERLSGGRLLATIMDDTA